MRDPVDVFNAAGERIGRVEPRDRIFLAFFSYEREGGLMPLGGFRSAEDAEAAIRRHMGATDDAA